MSPLAPLFSSSDMVSRFLQSGLLEVLSHSAREGSVAGRGWPPFFFPILPYLFFLPPLCSVLRVVCEEWGCCPPKVILEHAFWWRDDAFPWCVSFRRIVGPRMCVCSASLEAPRVFPCGSPRVLDPTSTAPEFQLLYNPANTGYSLSFTFYTFWWVCCDGV